MEIDTFFDGPDNTVELDTYLFFKDEWEAMGKTYTVLDLEVTAPFENQGEIMGISALRIDPPAAAISEFNVLVKTQHPAPEWLLKELELDEAHIARDAIDMAKALDALFVFIGDGPIFVHFAEFDRPFLDQAGSQCGKTLSNPIFDTRGIAELTWTVGSSSVLNLKEMLQLEVPSCSKFMEYTWITLATLQSAYEEAQLMHAKHIKVLHSKLPESQKVALASMSDICPICEITHTSALGSKLERPANFY